jgi:hypothetical protein
MSKIKFGNFITYRGKNLATPQAKAVNGNLVFAEITEGADQGYYIFGGVAGGHLVTMEVFNAVKKEVKELIGAGELAMPKHDDGTYYSIVEYVNGRLETLADYKVKDIVVGATSIVGASGIVELGDAAKKNVATAIAKDSTDLATAGQVFDAIDAIPEVVVAGSTGIAVAAPVTADGKTTYTVSVDETIATKDYVNAQVSKIDGVMEFKGTVTALPVVTKDSTDYNPGDVVVFNDEEYVLDKDYKWVEIGKVGVDDAVTSAKGSTYVSVAGNGEKDEKRGDITISVVTSDIKEGATGLATAADVYTAIENAKGAATVTGASGYLKVDDNKNVVVDAAQVQLGATSTDAKLATKGYVDDEIAKVGLEAAKHSSVKSASKTYIGVTGVTLENGSVEYQVSLEDAALAAENHTIGKIKKELEGGKEEILTEATTVQGALQELFEGQYTASASLDNLNDRLDAHIGSTQAHAAENITYAGASGITTTNVKDALDDLYSKVDNIEVPVTGVEGDAASYSDVATDEAGKVTVKNTLATAVDITGITGATAATATGLVTDAWVKDYITSILAWEILED